VGGKTTTNKKEIKPKGPGVDKRAQKPKKGTGGLLWGAKKGGGCKSTGGGPQKSKQKEGGRGERGKTKSGRQNGGEKKKFNCLKKGGLKRGVVWVRGNQRMKKVGGDILATLGQKKRGGAKNCFGSTRDPHLKESTLGC